MPSPFLLDVVGADAALVGACAAAVAGFGTIRAMGAVNTALKPAPDVLLLAIRVPIADGIAAFIHSRAARPMVPVVLIGHDSDVEVALELLKVGATDFVVRSTLAESLLPKLERALHLRHGVVPTHPALSALIEPSPSAPPRENRRRCYRARIASALVTMRLRDGEARLTLEDLSIPTDGWPGGIGLRVDVATGARLPFDAWQRGEAVPLIVQAAGEPAIAVTARLITASRRVVGAELLFAVDYLVDHPDGEAALRRLWINAQRQRLA